MEVELLLLLLLAERKETFQHQTQAMQDGGVGEHMQKSKHN